MSEVFENIKKVHFIGIGGIGMSGIAEYLAKNNYTVSGSDSYTTDISERLKNFGITIHEGHNADFLADDTELVIYSAAVKEDNPEDSSSQYIWLFAFKDCITPSRIIRTSSDPVNAILLSEPWGEGTLLTTLPF